ncbi:hypothetical protein [Hymenobacter sp. B81]|uniref:hypothetical protein n=1 Tax=Hymenobacter sp. B81 TaxID=3344878 RepID=UPI0037DD9B88
MKTYTEFLSDEQISVLRMLIGHSIYELHSWSLTVLDEHMETPVVSIPFNRQWMNIYSHWLETPLDLNYHKLVVELSEQALYPERPSSRIRIDKGRRPRIESIEVFSVEDIWGEECIKYDTHIKFNLSGDYSFCISVIDNAAELLNVSTNKEYINTLTQGHTLRLVLF